MFNNIMHENAIINQQSTKFTSERLFNYEVRIMSEVLKRLNTRGIYVVCI